MRKYEKGNTIYLFICDLFNDTVNSSDYITSNDKFISE
jgi:hypothetical protein